MIIPALTPFPSYSADYSLFAEPLATCSASSQELTRIDHPELSSACAIELIRAAQCGSIKKYGSYLGKFPLIPPSSLACYLKLLMQEGLESGHLQFLQQRKIACPPKLQKWLSGNSEKARNFKDPNINFFFANLFEWIAAECKETQVSLAGFDLYHGHLFGLKDPANGQSELGLLFHAKEYPLDHPMVSFNPSLAQGSNQLSTDDDFHLRNYLWLMSSNKVLLLNPKLENFDLTLIPGPQAEFFTVAPEYFNSNLIGDLNYFRPEGLFFAPNKGL